MLLMIIIPSIEAHLSIWRISLLSAGFLPVEILAYAPNNERVYGTIHS